MLEYLKNSTYLNIYNKEIKMNNNELQFITTNYNQLLLISINFYKFQFNNF